MRFAHIADCHLGGWRDQKLQQLNLEVFRTAIQICMDERVKFVLIAGDLFDTSMPPIEILEETFVQLRRLRDAGISCYIIAGSHDYSTSGKTFLNILEKAGFCCNVSKLREDGEKVLMDFTLDGNLLLAGVPGKKAGLERNVFKNLVMDDLKKHQDKIKIFMMHTTISEVKPKELEMVETIEGVYLPDGFDYYAAGHLHEVKEKKVDKRFIIYPGPLFPNNFAELEQLKYGNFCIVEIDEQKKYPKITRKEIILREVMPIKINVDNQDAETATQTIIKEIAKQDIKDKIVLLRIEGCLNGKTSDVRFDEINLQLTDSYTFLRNISDLTSRELKIEITSRGGSIEEIEKNVVDRYLKQENNEFSQFVYSILKLLDLEKQEGETNASFESRINEEAMKIMNLQDLAK